MAKIISFDGTEYEGIDTVHLDYADTPPATPATTSAPPVPSVITAMEELLRQARAGEIVGMVTVTLTHDYATSGAMAGMMNYSLVGRLEHVKISLLEDM